MFSKLLRKLKNILLRARRKLFLFFNKRSIYFVNNEYYLPKLEKILQKYKKDEIRCANCGRVLEFTEICAFIELDYDVDFFCDSIECLLKRNE